MADDLSLLLRIKGDSSSAKAAVADTRTAIGQLRTSLQTTQNSLQAVGGPLGSFSGQIGNASSLLSVLSTDAASTGGALAGMAGPIGIAVAAFAALATGVIALSKQFIDLTISTAQWEGKFYDLAQQTGVSVELLSGLSAAAEDTGGSIESVAQSLVIFQGHLDEAQDSASKAGQKFADLGISTNNTEQAFRDALRVLAAMPEGFRQTNEAAELFGRRGGKQVLAILKETGGDIDSVIEKLRKLDSLVTTDVARTADGLNDQLNATQRQFKGLQAQIVNESMPLIIRALKQLEKILRENRETFILLGQAIGLFLQGNFRILAPAMDIASRAVDGHKRALLPLIEAYERLAAAMQIVTGSIPNIDPNAIPAVKTPTVFNPGATAGAVSQILGATNRPKGSGGGGRAAARDTALQDAIRESELVERELRQKIDADIFENRRALANHVRDIEEFTRRGIELSDQQVNATIDRINAEIAALDSALAKKLISQKEYARKNKELDIETKAAVQKNAEEISELEDRRDRDIADAELAAHKRSAQIADEANDRLIKTIQDRIDRQWIAESEGEKQIAVLVAEGYERRKRLLEDEIDDFSTSLERKREISDELIRLDGERADAAERAARRIREAQESELSQRPRRVKDATRPRSVEEDEFGRPLEEELSAWESGLDAMQDRMEEFHNAANSYVVEGFHNMADAATSAIAAWILYGGSLGKALKQALAVELAHVAARAAIQAALHGAFALGSLAFGDFAGAAKHGIAALKFAAVAVAAGIGAKVLAGGAFAQQGASGGGSAGAGSRSNTAREQTRPFDLARTQQRQEIHVFLHSEPGPGFGDAVINTFVRDVRRNGVARDVIIHTAGG